MPEPQLVLPFDVEGEIVGVIGRRHPDHLAKLERQRDLAPRTYGELKTVVRMSDSQAVRLSGDSTPALLLGIIGAPQFDRNENDKIDATFQLGMQVTVLGTDRRDVILRRDIYAWTVIECVYQRLKRDLGALIHTVRLTDYEPLAEADKQQTVGDARLVWEVVVKDVLSIKGLMPSEANPNQPTDPYDPPAEPPVAETSVDLQRVPLDRPLVT